MITKKDLNLNKVLESVNKDFNKEEQIRKQQIKDIEKGILKAIGYKSLRTKKYNYCLPYDIRKHNKRVFIYGNEMLKNTFKEIDLKTFQKIKAIEKEIKKLNEKKNNIIKKAVLNK